MPKIFTKFTPQQLFLNTELNHWTRATQQSPHNANTYKQILVLNSLQALILISKTYHIPHTAREFHNVILEFFCDYWVWHWPFDIAGLHGVPVALLCSRSGRNVPPTECECALERQRRIWKNNVTSWEGTVTHTEKGLNSLQHWRSEQDVHTHNMNDNTTSNNKKGNKRVTTTEGGTQSPCSMAWCGASQQFNMHLST